MANKNKGSKNVLKQKQDKTKDKTPRYMREAAAAESAKVSNLMGR